jgi:hypothetical protein
MMNDYMEANNTFGPRLEQVMQDDYYYNKVNEALAKYPIYDEAFRPILNQQILDHFWLREIGAETPAAFAFYLGRRLREKMPQINIVFSALANSDPLSNNDIHIQDNRKGSTSDNTDASSTVNQSTTSSSDGTTHDTSNTTSDSTGSTTGQTSGTETGSNKSNTTGTDKRDSTSRSLNSQNPNTSMTSQDIADYYDTGTFADANIEDATTGTQEGSDKRDTSGNSKDTTLGHATSQTVSDGKNSTTGKGDSSAKTIATNVAQGTSLEDYIHHKYGREGVSLPDAIANYYDGYNNATQLVFDVLEPCFTQFLTDHYNAY